MRNIRLDVTVKGRDDINKKMDELQQALNTVCRIASDLAQMGADVELKMPTHAFPVEMVNMEIAEKTGNHEVTGSEKK